MKRKLCGSFSNFKCCPVRPLDQDPEDHGWERPEDADVLVDNHGVQVDQQDLISAEDGMVVQKTQALPEPLVPTRAQVEAHNVGGHLPYRS